MKKDSNDYKYKCKQHSRGKGKMNENVKNIKGENK